MLFALGGDHGAKALSEGVLVAHHEIDYKRPLVYHPRGVDIENVGRRDRGRRSFEIRYERCAGPGDGLRLRRLCCVYDLTASRPPRSHPEERAFLERYLDTDD